MFVLVIEKAVSVHGYCESCRLWNYLMNRLLTFKF